MTDAEEVPAMTDADARSAMTDTEGGPTMMDADARHLDESVLTLIQSGFPVCSHPYAHIAKQVGCGEDEAFGSVMRMHAAGTIRRIGAVFDPYHLGYVSTLCALAVTDPDDVDRVAQIINAYPGVTHNYLRDNHYNLWFTIISHSTAGTHEVLDGICRMAGYHDVLDLPARRLFKIRVDFDLLDGARSAGASASGFERAASAGDMAPASGGTVADALAPTPGETVPDERVPVRFTAADIEVIKALQEDLSGEREPYAMIAARVNETAVLADDPDAVMTEEGVIGRIVEWKDGGAIRRFGAVVAHRRLGFTYNAMVVWDVPDEQTVTAGRIMAGFREVSHCYERPRADGWDATLYTMVHGRDEGECEAVVVRIGRSLEDAGVRLGGAPELLYSTRELKRASMRYFME